tara:strand:- start:1222 stop:1971 length:750 start_codon:yes stop_codon:yes gene_type:complete
MGKIIKLTESDLTRIIKKVINEDNVQGGGTDGMGRGTGYHRETLTNNIKSSFNFDKDKMKTGSDLVDVTSSEYNSLLHQLQGIVKSSKIRGPINVNVEGGASSVGSSRGFDNTALAKSRANKLITQLTKDIPNIGKKIKFSVKGTVGKATKLNSSEAYKEQYVKVFFDANEINDIKQFIELDNLTVNVNPYTGGKGNDNSKLPLIKLKMKRVCLQIPEKYVDEFRVKVREFKNSHLDIGSIPFGVTDIK